MVNKPQSIGKKEIVSGNTNGIKISTQSNIVITSGSVPKLKRDMVVVHTKYGEGTVKLDKNTKTFYVVFKDAKRKFNYPDAFRLGYLKIKE